MHEPHHHDHPHADGLPGQRRSALYVELIHHLPFSVSAVAIGLTMAGLICFITPAAQIGEENCSHTAVGMPGEETDSHAHETHNHAVNPYISLFHLFHTMHILFSAAATTAMFWRYEQRLLKAVVIGLIGAVGVCGMSDVIMPQISMWMMGQWMPWHICILLHPQMVLSFAAVGIGIGLLASPSVRMSTFFSHSLHVFSSTMATIFYLIGPFGRLGWIESIGSVFLFVIVAVMGPCCVSDIIFPLFLISPAKNKYQNEHRGCACAPKSE